MFRMMFFLIRDCPGIGPYASFAPATAAENA